jgi:hypothetical protein
MSQHLQEAYNTKGKDLSEKTKTPLAAEWLVTSECRGQGYDNMTSRSPGKYLRNNSEALNDPYASQI